MPATISLQKNLNAITRSVVYRKIRNQRLCHVRQPTTFFIGSLSTDRGINAVSFLCSLTFFHFKLSGILTEEHGKISPKGAVCGLIGGVQVLLPCVACDIRNSSFDIRQLRHLNKAVPCHKSSPFCFEKVRSHFATGLPVAAVSEADSV